MNLGRPDAVQTDARAHTNSELIEAQCRRAQQLEEAGNYEAARASLCQWWQRIGEPPRIEGLERGAAAELLLRAGALSGWLGAVNQISGAQEAAKDLISRSASIFEELGEAEKVAEARIDLATCYWREGAFDEARVVLGEALQLLADGQSELRARALITQAMIERSATRYADALRILSDAAPLVETISNHLIKGRFHNQLAIVLEILGTADNTEAHLDRALVEYTAASFHFERGGHLRFVARVENNLGLLFFTIGKFTEADQHLKRARRLFFNLKDIGSLAQVDETRGRALLALGQNSEAERVLRASVRTLERGDEQALLSKTLVTQGTALARLGRTQQALATFERASLVASEAGDMEGAGKAMLTLIEELGAHLSMERLRALYERADEMLAQTQHPGVLGRLRACARQIVARQQRHAQSIAVPLFVYKSERAARLLEEARALAEADGSILITGETGTGKELLARLVHHWSGREGRFVSINCAALSETLFESQLFGHRKGSFTGAQDDYEGAARVAAGGTLFLDEVSALSANIQSKLLRLVEYGEVHTVGAIMPERVNLRVISSTSSNLKELVAAGRFRSDLFYRLETFNLEIPPLRERPADIPALASHFIEEAVQRHGKQLSFTSDAIEALSALVLRGNARELRSIIERTLLVAREGATITAEMVEIAALRPSQNASLADPWAGFSLKHEIHRLEQRFIEMALKEAKGKVSHAARLLGFKHHESLSSLLKSRFRNLQTARKPSSPRRRSIIPKYDQ